MILRFDQSVRKEHRESNRPKYTFQMDREPKDQGCCVVWAPEVNYLSSALEVTTKYIDCFMHGQIAILLKKLPYRVL